ncbi:MAG: IclR family transcriptional regulator [Homoserinimonas sp.]
MGSVQENHPVRADVASLAKGFLVLENVASADRPQAVASIINQTGLDRSTVNRMLRSLVQIGYLQRHGRGRYGLGHRSYPLGAQLQSTRHLTAAALPAMRELQSQVSETVNLGILNGVAVAYIARLATARILTPNIDVGTQLPACNSSLGRAILSFMPEDAARRVLEQSERIQVTPHTLVEIRDLMADLRRTRRRGFSLTSHQMELGVRSIAAPIFANGNVVAAINVTVTSARYSEEEMLATLRRPLLQAAQTLSKSFTTT